MTRNAGSISRILLPVLLVLCILGAPAASSAQFLDLQLEVESQLSATTEQPLNFGTAGLNMGRVEIRLGDANMGIFSIRALENQLLSITLNIPSELHHDNPAVEQTIPLMLEARYGYSAQNYEDSYPLSEAGSLVEVASTSSPGPWSLIYIFMYGAVEIGNVPDGVYTSEIVLSVEYI